MKKFFTKIYNVVKAVVFILIVGVAFYSGMYVTAYQNNNDNPADVIEHTIAKTFENTDHLPIIVIKPQPSLYERAKLFSGFKPAEREVIEMVTTGDTFQLADSLITPPETVTKASIIDLDWAKKTWAKWSDWVTFWK